MTPLRHAAQGFLRNLLPPSPMTSPPPPTEMDMAVDSLSFSSSEDLPDAFVCNEKGNLSENSHSDISMSDDFSAYVIPTTAVRNHQEEEKKKTMINNNEKIDGDLPLPESISPHHQTSSKLSSGRLSKFHTNFILPPPKDPPLKAIPLADLIPSTGDSSDDHLSVYQKLLDNAEDDEDFLMIADAETPPRRRPDRDDSSLSLTKGGQTPDNDVLHLDAISGDPITQEDEFPPPLDISFDRDDNGCGGGESGTQKKNIISENSIVQLPISKTLPRPCKTMKSTSKPRQQSSDTPPEMTSTAIPPSPKKKRETIPPTKVGHEDANSSSSTTSTKSKKARPSSSSKKQHPSPSRNKKESTDSSRAPTKKVTIEEIILERVQKRSLPELFAFVGTHLPCLYQGAPIAVTHHDRSQVPHTDQGETSSDNHTMESGEELSQQMDLVCISPSKLTQEHFQHIMSQSGKKNFSQIIAKFAELWISPEGFVVPLSRCYREIIPATQSSPASALLKFHPPEYRHIIPFSMLRNLSYFNANMKKLKNSPDSSSPSEFSFLVQEHENIIPRDNKDKTDSSSIVSDDPSVPQFYIPDLKYIFISADIPNDYSRPPTSSSISEEGTTTEDDVPTVMKTLHGHASLATFHLSPYSSGQEHVTRVIRSMFTHTRSSKDPLASQPISSIDGTLPQMKRSRDELSSNHHPQDIPTSTPPPSSVQQKSTSRNQSLSPYETHRGGGEPALKRQRTNANIKTPKLWHLAVSPNQHEVTDKDTTSPKVEQPNRYIDTEFPEFPTIDDENHSLFHSRYAALHENIKQGHSVGPEDFAFLREDLRNYTYMVDQFSLYKLHVQKLLSAALSSKDQSPSSESCMNE